jgi:hypothetical protein
LALIVLCVLVGSWTAIVRGLLRAVGLPAWLAWPIGVASGVVFLTFIALRDEEARKEWVELR